MLPRLIQHYVSEFIKEYEKYVNREIKLNKMEWNLIYFSSVEVDKRKNEKELDIFCYYTHNHFFGSKDGILKQPRKFFKCYS